MTDLTPRDARPGCARPPVAPAAGAGHRPGRLTHSALACRVTHAAWRRGREPVRHRPPDVSNSLGWMSPDEWLAAREAESEQTPAAEIIARPTIYHGTRFRSELEAGWARTLDHLSITEWEYERHACRLPSGTGYLPDFWLPDLRTFIEVKGNHPERRHKPEELAEEVNQDVIVLIGWPPVRKRNSPYLWESYLNWADPLGYDTRLAICPECSGWQWMRAQLSRDCRLCGAPHSGLLAKPGEITFHPAEAAGRPVWMRRRLCHGSDSTISTRSTAR